MLRSLLAVWEALVYMEQDKPVIYKHLDNRICFRASEKPRGFVFGSVAVDHFNIVHNVSTCFNIFLVALFLDVCFDSRTFGNR